MISFDNINTIFFDYDGTIHNSINIYAPAFRKAYNYLVMHKLAKEREWSEEEISYWLGFNPTEMWKTFMPNFSDDLRNYCSNLVAEEMRTLISQGHPALYEGAIEVLEYLKNKGYHLVFISNCKFYYMNSHRKLFGLDRYFEDFVCSEQYDFIPKYKILNMIMHNYPENMVMIGDREQDIEAAKKNGISAIGCSYGFARSGELKEADILINHIKELKQFL